MNNDVKSSGVFCIIIEFGYYLQLDASEIGEETDIQSIFFGCTLLEYKLVVSTSTVPITDLLRRVE